MLDPRTVLVLAPHTDDGELGCGGTIAKLSGLGFAVYYAAFSTARQSLPPDLPPDTLKVEVAAATARLGIDPSRLKVYDYEVRKLSYSRQEVLEDLVALKREIEPDLVLMPCLHDIHQDHATIADEGLRAFKDRTILGYELIWNNLSFNTECFVRLDEEHVERKIEALSEYRSQEGRAYIAPDFIRSLAITRGVQIGVEFAECFEVVRWVI
ncbi:MAG: PIG-L deacetylase family protein [Desulfobacteraceae bacterium]